MSSFGSARIARKSIVIESVPAQVRVIWFRVILGFFFLSRSQCSYPFLIHARNLENNPDLLRCDATV